MNESSKPLRTIKVSNALLCRRRRESYIRSLNVCTNCLYKRMMFGVWCGSRWCTLVRVILVFYKKNGCHRGSEQRSARRSSVTAQGPRSEDNQRLRYSNATGTQHAIRPRSSRPFLYRGGVFQLFHARTIARDFFMWSHNDHPGWRIEL